MRSRVEPLQFQKHLRLHEARRLIFGDELDAGSASLRNESTIRFSCGPEA
jgi:hypothetical protein